MSRLRVGMLGCGNIAHRHARSITALADRMDLVACCGRDEERVRAFAGQHGGEVFTDADRMFANAALDLVIVTLPPFARAGEVERAAAAGINLLVEKPLALDDATARTMVRAVEETGVVAAVGFMYRFGDAVARWRALAQGGGIGPVGLFAGSYHCNALHSSWWPTRVLSGGQMVEQVIHLVDLVRYLVGEPDTVYARAANLFHRDVPGYDVEDVSSIVFGWDDGRLATLHASNAAVPGRWTKEWLVVAERMTGRFTDWNKAVLTRTSPEVMDETVSTDIDPFIAQLADVADAIRDRRRPCVPLCEGAASLRLVLAARRSAELRRELRLSDEV